MYPWYTYVAGQPQLDPYLLQGMQGQQTVSPMQQVQAQPVLPPPKVTTPPVVAQQVHQVGSSHQVPPVHGKHFVNVSTALPQAVQVPYMQTVQTPIKVESPVTPPPMAMTPQMTPKTPKTPKSEKTNSDSLKDDEHVSFKSQSSKKRS